MNAIQVAVLIETTKSLHCVRIAIMVAVQKNSSS